MMLRTILVSIVIFLVFSGCIIPMHVQAYIDYKNVTHEEVKLSVLQKDSVKIFYTSSSSVQNALAEQALDIIYKQYEICSKIMGLSVEELNSCSLVFCDDENDPYVVECSWFSYVDEVQCWPIIGETSLSFEKPINEYLFYHLLPHEIADTTLRVRNVDPTYGGWFIEGVGEYVRLKSAEHFDKLNTSFWLNSVRAGLADLSSQKWRIVDLSDRSSFEGYGAPGSKDQLVFYVGSLVFIYDLVEKYGDKFISDVIANNCTSHQEIRDVIKRSTGYNIDNSIKNVSVGWILEKYISLLQDLNVNISELRHLKKTRGIAVGSNIIVDESAIFDIVDFIDDCNINMVVVDFGWITWSWNNTVFDYVSIFINESKQKDIPTWLMYRARTLEGEYKHLQHQVNKNGELDERNICFTDNECIKWSIDWAHKLLQKYPTVNGIILYNPYFLPDGCYCPTCLETFRNDAGIDESPLDFGIGTLQYNEWLNWKKEKLASFMSKWKNSLNSFYPDLKFGLVLNSGDSATAMGQDISVLSNIVDMVCPFVALDSVIDDNFAGNICNNIKETANATIIANIKIYGPYDNSDSDIINAMKSVLESDGDGFFIWNYDFLISGKYNIDSIKMAYNPYYLDFYPHDKYTSDENILQFYIGIIMFIIATLSIAIIFFYERKEKTK